MHSIQLREGQNRGCLHELGFWALGGRGHWHSGASWAQGPSCGSSGWLCIQANKSIAKESLSCCQKLVVTLKDIFCAPMGEEGRVLPGGGKGDRAVGPHSWRKRAQCPNLRLCTPLPRLHVLSEAGLG